MKSNKPLNGRRDFLKGAAITAAAATVAATVSKMTHKMGCRKKVEKMTKCITPST